MKTKEEVTELLKQYEEKLWVLSADSDGTRLSDDEILEAKSKVTVLNWVLSKSVQ